MVVIELGGWSSLELLAAVLKVGVVSVYTAFVTNTTEIC